MNEFDLSSAVDEIFGTAKPGEILKNWKEWGCGQYAGAGVPFFCAPEVTKLNIRSTEQTAIFLDEWAGRLSWSHGDLPRINVLDIPEVFLSANFELALAA